MKQINLDFWQNELDVIPIRIDDDTTTENKEKLNTRVSNRA